jgi:uncharacterized protein (TIGR02246 family)
MLPEAPEVRVSIVDRIGGIEFLIAGLGSKSQAGRLLEWETRYVTKESPMKHMIMTVAMLTGNLGLAIGAEPEDQAAAEAAIRKAVQSYVAAYNGGDGKALAALWSPDAVYTSPLTGEQVFGREAIEAHFTAMFEELKGVRLEVNSDSIQFVSPNVAIESGTAKVVGGDQAPEISDYTAVYLKRDGQWLLDRVTEEDVPVVTTNYEKLKDLEWMIGTWVDEDEVNRIETTCQWTKNQNFITRAFTISVRDRIDMAGIQFVGWDPAAKQIRSWVFDSDGGFGEGIWTRKDNTWYIQATGTLPDGTKSTAVNIITYLDDDTMTWQSVNQVTAGEILPNVDEVVVVRQPTSE